MFLICDLNPDHWQKTEKQICPIFLKLIKKSKLNILPKLEIITEDFELGLFLYAEACVYGENNHPTIRLTEKCLSISEQFIEAIIAHEIAHLENDHHIKSIKKPHARIIEWEICADARASELTNKSKVILMIRTLIEQKISNESKNELELRLKALGVS